MTEPEAYKLVLATQAEVEDAFAAMAAVLDEHRLLGHLRPSYRRLRTAYLEAVAGHRAACALWWTARREASDARGQLPLSAEARREATP
jgi:hypothetical protein